MSAATANAISPLDDGSAASAHDELAGMLTELRRFVDRRFCELSVEVHGAVQMLDFSENNLSGQIAAIQNQIASLVAAPAEATHNSGLELEAVVQATESAAERILDAAETIGDWVSKGIPDPEGFKMLAAKVNTIFEACSFQDLTGQRIRRAIDQLQRVEGLLEGMMNAVPKPHGVVAAAPAAAPATKAQSQAAIGGTGDDLGQSAIDSLLDF